VKSAKVKSEALSVVSDTVLEVSDLRVYFYTEEGEIRAVDGVSFAMKRGRITALVGESGCGKSVTSYSILRLIQKPGKIMGGRILFYPSRRGNQPTPGPSQEGNGDEEPTPSPSEEGNGDEEPTPSPSEEGNGDEEPTPSPSEEGNGEEEPTPNPSEEGNMDEAPLLGGVGGGSASEFGTCIDITSLSEKSDALFNLRGGKISMIFQEPMTALSPVHTVGNQICEAILLHQDVTESEARAKAIEMLGKVGIPGPEQRIDQYPFEMSGGMRQRVVIAMALVCNPEILIADEPTTALDVTIQAQIMGLIKGLQRDLGTSTLLITHDLGVVAQLADDVAVMYLGRIVERGPVRDIMKDPKHPYTQGLLKSLPSLSMEKARLPSIEGSVPSLTEIPPGCPFHPRCPSAKEGLCNTGSPPVLEDIAESRAAACVRLKDLEVANA